MTMTIHSAANNSNAAPTSASIAAAGGRPAGDDLSSTNQVAALASRNQASAANAANATVTAKAAAPATSPLFAHVLGSANGAVNTIDAARTAADDTADVDQAQSDASSTADAGGLLPAMAGSLFTAAMPALAPNPVASLLVQGTAAGTTGDDVTAQDGRGDTRAVSTLYAAATPFNLSAAGVAVTTATGAAPATRYDASQDANQMVLAQQAQRLADGAVAPAAAGATSAATSAAAPAPPADTRPVAATAEPLANLANAANAASMALAAAAPVAAVRPAIPASPAPAAKAAPAANAVADLALPRVAVRVAAAPVDAAVAPGTNTASQTGAAPDDSQGSGKFASALAGTASAAPAGLVTAAPTATAANAAVVKLAGAPEQWQQPLRDALGDRLQVNLQRNNDHAVIRLDPPNMGSIEISIRHTAGALQVNLSASNSEVVRQLNNIGDSVRQDLSNRQFTEVAVTVSSARAQAQGQADGGRQQREQQEQERQRTPGRALYGDDAANTFAMNDQE